MRWNGSSLSWQEFERTLSGRGSWRAGRATAALPQTPAAGARSEGPRSAQPPPPQAGEEQHPVSQHRTVQQPAAQHPTTQHSESETSPPLGPPTPYAELHAHSHYSFLDGAASPEDLVAEAARLQLTGLALTDHNGFYGAARFAEAAEAHPELLTVYGAELSLDLETPQLGVADPQGTHLLVLAQGAAGYHRLASAITEGQLAGGEKGRPVYDLEALAAASGGEWAILTGCRKGALRRALDTASSREAGTAAARVELDRLTGLFGRDHVFVELTDHGHPGDDARVDRLAALADEAGLPALATGGVHYARREQAPLAEAVAAVRARRSLDELDPFLAATGSAHLRSGRAMWRRFAHHRDAVTRTAELSRELAFPLRSARPGLPHIDVPSGHTQMSWLRELVFAGAERRYGTLTPKVTARLERELAVIAEKDFPGYFLIVFDIVRQAGELGILCQGRGSAANSAVCYALCITAVDSIKYDLPFERFLSSMRHEEPDIDVDFDSERREEIIQYVYGRYGRHNAAQVANVISYRPKAAIRDAAKALGYGPGQQRAWTRGVENRREVESVDGGIPAPVTALATQLLKAPRHLGIHSGGMVLTERPVGEVCPIEHARMEGRTVLQWDKDDCAAMGLVKFDLLGLGMLGALRATMDIVVGATGERWDLDTIPKEEPGVYDMLCRADAIGVFQVESRAQMNTLPRLKPREFYDLVIEIALIRPGPMQGGAVHPYLRRRSGAEEEDYPHPTLEPVLKRTLGVPLFQEQLMQMAMAVGDCSAEDADLLRRAMGSKRGVERIGRLRAQLIAGMGEHGIEGEAAERLYAQIEAFADFGFAESHSVSFALLVYASSWFKLHYPAAFLAGLLRSQPMGFYSARTLVEDARRHGVEVLPPDVQTSEVHTSLQANLAGERRDRDETARDRAADAPDTTGPLSPTGMESCADATQPAPGVFDPGAPDTGARHRRDGVFAVRLGLAEVRGVDDETAIRIVEAREARPFISLADLARRADLDRSRLESLAAAGACGALGGDRREALWAAAPAADNRERFLPGIAVHVQPPLLPMLNPAEQTALDLWTTGVATGTHPMALLRGGLDARDTVRSDRIRGTPSGSPITVAGLVTHRQQPATARGVTFITLEDESGSVNIVVWANVWARYRAVARTSPALVVHGVLERSPEGVSNLIANRFEPLTAPAAISSRDFR